MAWRKYSEYTEGTDLVRQAIIDAYANFEIARGLDVAGQGRPFLNGAFQFDQPNAGAAVAVATATKTFGPDGVYGAGIAASGVFSMQQFATGGPARADGAVSSYVRFKTTTADATLGATDLYYAAFPVEGLRWSKFGYGASAASQAVLSAFMRTSRTGGASIPCAIKNSARDRAYPGLLTISAANSWERPKLTVPGDTSGTWLTDTGKGGELVLGLGLGSNYIGTANAWAGANTFGAAAAAYMIQTLNETLDVTGIDFTPGQIEPAFYIPPDPQTELARLLREYEKSFPMATAPAQNAGVTGSFLFPQPVGASLSPQAPWVDFKVIKRTTPVTLPYNPSAANSQIRNNAIGADWSGCATVPYERGFGISGNTPAGSAVGNQCGVHWSADARLS